MLNLFGVGPDPSMAGMEPNGVTTGGKKKNPSRTRSLSRANSTNDNIGGIEGDGEKKRGRRRPDTSPVKRIASTTTGKSSIIKRTSSNTSIDSGSGKGTSTKSSIKRNDSGATLDRLTRSGSGVKLEEALKRSGSGARLAGIKRVTSGTRLQIGPRSGSSRNLSRSGSSQNLDTKNANWSKNDDAPKSPRRGPRGSKSPVRGGGLSRSGSTKKVGGTGSSRNLGVTRTRSKKNDGKLSRSNSGLNLAALTVGDPGADMVGHLDKIEAFVQLVNESSQKDRDKILMDAMVHKTSKTQL